MVAEIKLNEQPGRNGQHAMPLTPSANAPTPQAFGEWLGVAVPTRYREEVHALANMAMVGDSLITPLITGMGKNTIMVCWALAGLLFITRQKNDSLTLRQALQIELVSGLLLLVLAVRGTFSKRWWENSYLFFGGLLMIANALMTELDPE
jgi:hypothetical protein